MMYHVIVNPKSRSGRGAEVWIKVKTRFLLEGQKFQEYITRYRGHGTRLAKTLTGDKWNHEDILVVIGGDGTVNEVVSGITELSKVTLGYIPTGSGNDFARGVGIPDDTDAAINSILHPERIMKVDIGKNIIGGRIRRFTISSGMGFDAAICHEALSSGIKDTLNRLKLGKLTYACIALRQLASFQSCSIRVTPEFGEALVFRRAFFAVAMNLPYEGGGLKFAPDALCDDGMLDVMIVSEIPKWKVLCVLPMAFKGWHTRFREVHTIRCRSVKIEAAHSLAVHLDGESGAYQQKMELSVENEKLRVCL